MPGVRPISTSVLVFGKFISVQQLLVYMIFYEGSCKHDKLYMNGADISSLLYVKSNTFKRKKKRKKTNQKDSLPATRLY